MNAMHNCTVVNLNPDGYAVVVLGGSANFSNCTIAAPKTAALVLDAGRIEFKDSLFVGETGVVARNVQNLVAVGNTHVHNGQAVVAPDRVTPSRPTRYAVAIDPAIAYSAKWRTVK